MENEKEEKNVQGRKYTAVSSLDYSGMKQSKATSP